MRNRLNRGVIFASASFFAGTAAFAADNAVDFNHDVRHIFSNHCYACLAGRRETQSRSPPGPRKRASSRNSKMGRPLWFPGDLRKARLVGA